MLHPSSPSFTSSRHVSSSHSMSPCTAHERVYRYGFEPGTRDNTLTTVRTTRPSMMIRSLKTRTSTSPRRVIFYGPRSQFPLFSHESWGRTQTTSNALAHHGWNSDVTRTGKVNGVKVNGILTVLYYKGTMNQFTKSDLDGVLPSYNFVKGCSVWVNNQWSTPSSLRERRHIVTLTPDLNLQASYAHHLNSHVRSHLIALHRTRHRLTLSLTSPSLTTSQESH